jgi:hypothetical protein
MLWTCLSREPLPGMYPTGVHPAGVYLMGVHTLDELAFRSQAGVIGSWIGFIFSCLILIAQFCTGT